MPKSQNSETLQTTITLKEGIYSIIILDDENSNGKMDYRLKIFPKEAFGFSNNAKVKGAKRPSFNECAFKINSEENSTIKIGLKKF